MTPIAPDEKEIVAHQAFIDGRVIGDSNWSRICELVESHLVEIASGLWGWESLYRDPVDDRLWERTFPDGHLQGGGPPLLRCLAREQAEAKYGGNIILAADAARGDLSGDASGGL